LVFQVIFVLLCVSWVRGHEDAEEARERMERLLNVFTIVKFPNDACNATGGNYYGTCYTATECTALGGTASGTCASGFGVCCTLTGRCGGSTSVNNTYFAADGSESSPCSFKVCKASDDICQIRLGFDLFSISQPQTEASAVNTVPNARTQCQRATFTANSDGPSPPTICGTNTGYHMILEARDDCNTLTFTWSSGEAKDWNIHVSQILCSDPFKPPDGCTQYFTGVSGNIYSYNYQGGIHLANQDYNNCIRQEYGYCYIAYSGIDFQISNAIDSSTATETTKGDFGNDCSLDYIIIAEGSSVNTFGAINFNRFCGVLLSVGPAGSTPTTPATVYNRMVPFQLGFHTDATEVALAPANDVGADEASKGFNIYYEQMAC